MEPLVLREPWSWLVGDQQRLQTCCTVDGTGNPRVVADALQPGPVVALPAGHESLPPASFPFLVGRSQVQAFHLPTDARHKREREGFVVGLALGQETAELTQSPAAVRPSRATEGQQVHDPVARAVAGWVDWQVRGFQELAHLDGAAGVSELDAETRMGIVRRGWGSARRVWFRSGAEEARMALIVRLAAELPLHRALDTISRHPRRVLQRHRASTPIGRIEEMDAACIRDYARRPGVTAPEKGGPRQELLSVLRREHRDTLENRVACWVLEALAELAADYRMANAAFSTDGRVRTVRTFGNRTVGWRSSDMLQGVGSLPRPPEGPNYPLQFDARYKAIWRTYLRIRREKWVLDDAWSWQRVLWGETGRQLVACCLHELGDIARTVAESTPFYRSESRQGHWTEPPVAPGPFATAGGDCLLFDSRDIASPRMRALWLSRPPFEGAELVGSSGCDQVFLRPAARRALLVWHLYQAGAGGRQNLVASAMERCAAAMDQLQADFRRFAGSSIALDGLLFVADLGRSIAHSGEERSACVALEPGPSSGGCRVNALCLPPDVDGWERFVSDLKEGMGLVLEEFTHRA